MKEYTHTNWQFRSLITNDFEGFTPRFQEILYFLSPLLLLSENTFTKKKSSSSELHVKFWLFETQWQHHVSKIQNAYIRRRGRFCPSNNSRNAHGKQGWLEKHDAPSAEFHFLYFPRISRNWKKKIFCRFYLLSFWWVIFNSKAYSKPCQTSKTEFRLRWLTGFWIHLLCCVDPLSQKFTEAVTGGVL